MNNNVTARGPLNNQNLAQQQVIVPVMGQQAVPRPDVIVVVPRPNNLQNYQVVVGQPNQREVRLDIPLAQQGPNVNPNQVQHARVPYRGQGQVQENIRGEQLNRQPLSQQGQGGLFSQRK